MSLCNDVNSICMMSLDNYNRSKVIGKGSYGEVWLSKHKLDKKQVHCPDTHLMFENVIIIDNILCCHEAVMCDHIEIYQHIVIIAFCIYSKTAKPSIFAVVI